MLPAALREMQREKERSALAPALFSRDLCSDIHAPSQIQPVGLRILPNTRSVSTCECNTALC